MKYNFFTNLLQNPNGHLEIKFSNEVSISITDPSITEGDDGIKLMTFSISASRDLTGKESVTLNLNIEDLGTNSSDYGSLSDSSITFDSTNKSQIVTLEIIGDTKAEEDEDLWLDATVTNKTDLGEVTVVPGLGTILDDDKIVIEVSSVSSSEGDSGTQSTNVTVSLSDELSNAITIIMSNEEVVYIPAGSTSNTATVTWGAGVVDTIEDSDAPISISVDSFIYPAPGSVVVGNADEGITVGYGGEVRIIDDEPDEIPPENPNDGTSPPPLNPPPRRDPLVLDTNKDGFISTISLEDSSAYFDLTGDGIKEKVSWIGADDGILTYDKNDNGKIDGIDEVFGNLTTSGFSELKELIDSNNDGVINRRDELFSRLKIWHDNNSDDNYKESNETFYLHHVSTSGYSGTQSMVFADAGTGTILDDVNLQGYKNLLSTELRIAA